MDGTVVIKKKWRGTYYPMGQTRVVTGIYDRWNRPNLLPPNRWIGIKSRVYDGSGGVHIELSID